MNIVYSLISWAIGKLIEIAIFAIWLTFYLLGVLIKSCIWVASRGKADVTITHWNHSKAVRELLASDEDTVTYCGRGGWNNRLFQGYLSQIVYVYLTSRRVLLVSKNHGTHEIHLDEVRLATN